MPLGGTGLGAQRSAMQAAETPRLEVEKVARGRSADGTTQVEWRSKGRRQSVFRAGQYNARAGSAADSWGKGEPMAWSATAMGTDRDVRYWGGNKLAWQMKGGAQGAHEGRGQRAQSRSLVLLFIAPLAAAVAVAAAGDAARGGESGSHAAAFRSARAFVSGAGPNRVPDGHGEGGRGLVAGGIGGRAGDLRIGDGERGRWWQ